MIFERLNDVRVRCSHGFCTRAGSTTRQMNARVYHRKNTIVKFHVIALLLPLLLIGTVSASLGVISLEELTERADLIVYGTVESIDSAVFERDIQGLNSNLTVSIATVRIAPVRYLKGSPADPLVVKVVENMEDSPRFSWIKRPFYS